MTLLVGLGIVFAWALFTEPQSVGRQPGGLVRACQPAGRVSCSLSSRVPLARGLCSDAGEARGEGSSSDDVDASPTAHRDRFESLAGAIVGARRPAGRLRRRAGARHRPDRRARLRHGLADGGVDDRIRQPAHVAVAQPSLRHRRSELLPDGSDDDIVGSPYAISAYEPAENLGGEDGLAKLRARLAEAGLGLILDFVPNHTAPEHPWVRRHPDWYVHADAADRADVPDEWFEVRSEGRHWIAHGRDPNFGPWLDTAQLDYRHPDVPRAMTQTLREVATRCDGVVCSMAMLVLDDVFRSTWGSRSVAPVAAEDASPFGEFWWHASSAVRDVYPRFMLIGEAYWGLEWRLQQLGFDYTYDSHAAGPDADRRSGRGRRPPPGGRRLPAPLGAAPRGSQQPAHRGPDDAGAGARRGPGRGGRPGHAPRPRRPDRRAPASRRPSSSGANRPSRPTRTCTSITAGCCEPPTTRHSASARPSGSNRSRPGRATPPTRGSSPGYGSASTASSGSRSRT